MILKESDKMIELQAMADANIDEDVISKRMKEL